MFFHCILSVILVVRLSDILGCALHMYCSKGEVEDSGQAAGVELIELGREESGRK